MPYETGSASGPNDMLDKVRVFALANGFTVDYWGVRTNAGGGSQGNGLNALALNKGGLFWVLYHETASPTTSNPSPRIRAYTYPGPWVAANGSDLQANQTGITNSNNLTSFQAYHLFTDPAQNYLHLVVEVVSGRFSHVGIGRLNKSGGGSAVPYAYGLFWNFSPGSIVWNSVQHSYPFDSNAVSTPGTVFRADSDSVSPRNYSMRYVSAGSADGLGGFTINNPTMMQFTQQMAVVPPSALTGRAPLIPLIVLAVRTLNPQVASIVGAAPDMRAIRIDNITDGQLLTVGSDQWKCFPIIRKNGPSGVESSSVYGYAFRIVP